MEKDKKFKGYVIPNELLGKIHGGMGFVYGCPNCDCTETTTVKMLPLIYPTPLVCAKCYTMYQVIPDKEGGYHVRNLGKYNGPFDA